MEFNYKKCEKKVEFLHLKNKDSRLFELCDDCFNGEVLKANSEYQAVKYKNKYEKPFYIFVISFVILGGSYFCFTDGFSECRNDKGEEIGIAGVKDLINSYQNTSLKKELSKIIKDVESKSTKGQNFDQNNDENILEDDLTIIGLGK